VIFWQLAVVLRPSRLVAGGDSAVNPISLFKQLATMSQFLACQDIRDM
jgi:hypothetical protein